MVGQALSPGDRAWPTISAKPLVFIFCCFLVGFAVVFNIPFGLLGFVWFSRCFCKGVDWSGQALSPGDRAWPTISVKPLFFSCFVVFSMVLLLLSLFTLDFGVLFGFLDAFARAWIGQGWSHSCWHLLFICCLMAFSNCFQWCSESTPCTFECLRYFSYA